MFLTRAKFGRCRRCPELVFLNCCFLARLDEKVEREQAQRLKSVNSLAASVAEELINKGVKAVVAAGWAVDDARQRFSRPLFIPTMLAANLGGRGAHARFTTHEKNPYVNTWAAYQIAMAVPISNWRKAPRLSRARRPTTISAPGPNFCSDSHLEARPRMARSGRTRAWLRVELEGLEQALPPMWRERRDPLLVRQNLGELRVFRPCHFASAEALQRRDGLAPFRAAEHVGEFRRPPHRVAAGRQSGDEGKSWRWQRWKNGIAQLIEISGTRERWSSWPPAKNDEPVLSEGKARAALLVTRRALRKSLPTECGAQQSRSVSRFELADASLSFLDLRKSSRRTLKVERGTSALGPGDPGAQRRPIPDIEIWRRSLAWPECLRPSCSIW
jgi:hypothetical protein